jgi:hypothetical protein
MSFSWREDDKVKGRKTRLVWVRGKLADWEGDDRAKERKTRLVDD